MSFVIGQSDYFGFGFTTLNRTSLYITSIMKRRESLLQVTLNWPCCSVKRTNEEILLLFKIYL